MKTFYLGTHMPNWLGQTDIPLFISRRRLEKRKTFPQAAGRWALDSGGFSELSMYGEWRMTPAEYAIHVRRFSEEIGGMDWAAPMDWLCSPSIMSQTGESIVTHQSRTIDSVVQLRMLDLPVPIIPVLQGWHPPDYHQHVMMYQSRGIDLLSEPVVGIGSVSDRQAEPAVTALVAEIARTGIQLHGFGFKVRGLRAVGAMLSSADSMAWSFDARRRPPLDGCTHKTCANCFKFAKAWHGYITGIVADSQLC